MGIDGVFADARRDVVERFADRYVVPDPRSIIDDVNAAVDSWPQFAAEAGLAPGVAAGLAADHRRI
jgi:serine/threonine-protein kinase HipA